MIPRTMTWASRSKRASIFLGIVGLLTVSMSYAGTIWADIILGIFGFVLVVTILACVLKFVGGVLYRISGGYDREIRDELQDIRERLD